MAANVENMFSVRETPWHGQGVIVADAPTSSEAIKLAGLDWVVKPQPIFLADGTEIPDNVCNVRESDGSPLGIVGTRYSIIQNSEAFEFTDSLLGEGVKYETAGSLKNGKLIWLLAKLPDKFEVLGEKVDPYVCFTNSHDGSGAVKVICTNVRVVCNNTLNMALRSASRTWSARHTASVTQKLEQARQTLELAENYMKATNDLFEDLYKVKTGDLTIKRFVDNVIPITEAMTQRQKDNATKIRNDILFRYNEAPDLKVLDRTGARFIQAVADTTSHMNPARQTAKFAENRFKRSLEGNDLLNKAIDIVLEAA